MLLLLLFASSWQWLQHYNPRDYLLLFTHAKQKQPIRQIGAVAQCH